MGEIIVVGTEPVLRDMLTYSLGRRWRVIATRSTEQCLNYLVPPLPSVIISDVGRPGLEGLELCRRVRRDYPGVLVLLLGGSVRDLDDRIAGFAAGADDYLAQPFSMDELTLRVAALARRAAGMENRPERAYVCGDLCINLDRREVTRSDLPLSLTRYEFDLLVLLTSSPGRVFDHATLRSQVSTSGGLDSRHRIAVHIANLRRKINPDPPQPPNLVTIRGVGYKFVVPKL